MSAAGGVSPDPNAAAVISEAIEDDQSFIDTDGYRSIRMRSAEKYAEIALTALANAGFQVVSPSQEAIEDGEGSLPIARNANVDRLAEKLRSFSQSPELVGIDRVVWETVTCPWCFAGEGLACEDADGIRQPDASHQARVEAFYDFTEYRGQ